jgi:5'-nucleotidase
MAYSLEDKLVLAIASSALFDLAESDRVYRERGTEDYRRYQREHEKEVLNLSPEWPSHSFVGYLVSTATLPLTA